MKAQDLERHTFAIILLGAVYRVLDQGSVRFCSCGSAPALGIEKAQDPGGLWYHVPESPPAGLPCRRSADWEGLWVGSSIGFCEDQYIWEAGGGDDPNNCSWGLLARGAWCHFYVGFVRQGAGNIFRILYPYRKKDSTTLKILRCLFLMRFLFRISFRKMYKRGRNFCLVQSFPGWS